MPGYSSPPKVTAVASAFQIGPTAGPASFGLGDGTLTKAAGGSLTLPGGVNVTTGGSVTAPANVNATKAVTAWGAASPGAQPTGYTAPTAQTAIYVQADVQSIANAVAALYAAVKAHGLIA